MEHTPLQRNQIQQPQLWRLYLMVGSEWLDVMLFNVTDPEGIEFHRIKLDQSIQEPAKRIEETVYQNPLLLSDFSRVSILVDTDSYIVVPAEIAADSEMLRSTVDAQYADGASREPIVSEIPGQNAAIVAAVESPVARFLRRTFNNPSISHRLYPLCRYYHDKSRIGNSGKMYAHFEGNRMDVLVFGRNTLQMACTYTFKQPIDAVYYIMAARNSLGLSNSSSDELILSGDQTTRDALTPILREYTSSVMPAIYPSSLHRMGNSAPFPLMILPLCE